MYKVNTNLIYNNIKKKFFIKNILLPFNGMVTLNYCRENMVVKHQSYHQYYELLINDTVNFNWVYVLRKNYDDVVIYVDTSPFPTLPRVVGSNHIKSHRISLCVILKLMFSG